MTWHEYFSKAAKKAGLTQPSPLAKAVQEHGGRIDRQGAWKWLQGRGVPNLLNADALCKALPVEAETWWSLWRQASLSASQIEARASA